MLTIGCPQQVCASGKSTSTPSRRSSVTTARPVSGNIASLMQVTISATLIGHPCRSSQTTRRRTASGRGCGRPARAGLRGCRADDAVRRGPGPARCRARSPRPVRPAPAARAGRRSAWQSSAFWAPPPTTCTTPTSRPASAGRLSHGRARCAAARLSTMLRTSGDPAVRGRRRRARRTTPRSAPACRRAAGTAGPARRTTGTGPSYAAAGAQHARPGRSSPHVRSVSLQQPGAHHVGEEPDPAVDAALVGEVRGPGLLGEHRRGRARRRPAPRCRGDVRRVVGLHRDADHRGRGVVRADRDHRHDAADPLGDVGQQVADDARRGRRGRGRASGRGRAGPSARCPTPGCGRRAARWWRRWCARRRGSPVEPVGDQVGDQQQPRPPRPGRGRRRAGRAC